MAPTDKKKVTTRLKSLQGSMTQVGASIRTPAELNAAITGLPQYGSAGISNQGNTPHISGVDFTKPGKASIYDLKGKLIKTTADLSQVKKMKTGVYLLKVNQNGRIFESLISAL